MGKLPNFGVDMFFLKLLESKKWKNISFGVDMFFSNSWSPKNGKTYILVLVLTCFSQTPGVQKMGKMY